MFYDELVESCGFTLDIRKYNLWNMASYDGGDYSKAPIP